MNMGNDVSKVGVGIGVLGVNNVGGVTQDKEVLLVADMLDKLYRGEGADGKQYGVQVQDQGRLPQEPSALDIVNYVKNGGHISLNRVGFELKWHVYNMEELKSFVGAQMNNGELLSSERKQELSLIQQLKGKGVKFYANPKFNASIGVAIGPAFLIRDNSCYANVNGGPKEKVTNLEEFAMRNGINVNKASVMAQPPVTIMPTVVPAMLNQNAAVTPKQEVVTPVVTSNVTAVETPDVNAVSNEVPKVESPVENVPQVVITKIEDLKAQKAEEKAKEVVTPEAPKEEAKDFGLPDLFKDAIIAPAPQQIEEVKQTQKAKKIKDPNKVDIVEKELVFMLPPGGKQLASIKPSKPLTAVLARDGVSFIYMRVMSPSDGKLQNFLKEHPIVSKLIKEAGADSGTFDFNIEEKKKINKAVTKDLLFADIKEYENPRAFPANSEMATVLAIAGTSVASVHLSAANADALTVLSQYVKPEKKGKTEAKVEQQTVASPEAVKAEEKKTEEKPVETVSAPVTVKPKRHYSRKKTIVADTASTTNTPVTVNQ